MQQATEEMPAGVGVFERVVEHIAVTVVVLAILLAVTWRVKHIKSKITKHY